MAITIAYLTGEYPSVSHTFIQREIDAMRAQGLDVRTCSVRRPASENIVGEDQLSETERTFYILDSARAPFSILNAHIKLFVRSKKAWFSALSLAFRMRSPGLRALLYQVFYFVEAGVLADKLKRENVTHLHNHFGNSSCSVAMLTSVLSGISYSFTLHGPAIFFEPERWRIDEKIARAKYVACISHFCRSQAMLFSDQKHWPKLRIVHCGVELEKYDVSGQKKFEKRILFVGRLASVKGVPLLLDAFASVRSKHPSAILTIVGDGSDRHELELHSQRVGLSDVVEFTGYQDQQAVAALLKKSDLLVLPSFAEGVPVVLMEAMASRIPVIASQVAGIPELVKHGESGLIIPPGDLKMLSCYLDELLSDPEKCHRMGIAGRKMVEQEFSLQQEAARLKKLHLAEDMSEFDSYNVRG